MERDTSRDHPEYVPYESRDDTRARPETVSYEGRDPSRDVRWDRVTVPAAAGVLSVSQSAVRKRIQRGTIPWDKDAEGRVYVYVNPLETAPETKHSESRDGVSGPSRDELVAELRNQIGFLRGELERKDTILMSLVQRIPELEAPSEPRDAPETAAEGADRGTAPTDAQEPKERRSWLYRFFFGP